MVGPREWGPKEEPAGRTFHLAGLRIASRRRDKPAEGENQELYEVIVTAPDGTHYRHYDSNSIMERYQSSGHLHAAMSALLDIEFIQEDPDHYRRILEQVHGLSPVKARRFVERGLHAARSFDPKVLQEALKELNAEMNKIPSVQRYIKRSWDELRKRQNL